MVVGIDFGTANTSVTIIDGKKIKTFLDRYGSSSHPAAPGCSTEMRFKQIKSLVEEQTAGYADTAVVAVPAGIGDIQSREITDAAKKAGFHRIRLIPQAEATAAAMLHGTTGTVLVLDFGESSFKASLVEIKGNDISLNRCLSDSSTGGGSFTRDMCGLLKKKTGNIIGKLQNVSDAFKIALSSSSEYTSSVQGVPVSLDRRDYEKILGSRIGRIEDLVRQLLRSSGHRTSEIDTVLLAGGGSHIPCIQSCVSRIFRESVPVRICPADTAARGALLLFQRRTAPVQGTVGISPSDFGLEIDWGRPFWMMQKDRPLPALEKRIFTTLADNQRRAEIHVIQRSTEDPSRSVSLSRIMLPKIPPALQGRPKIEIQFVLHSSGMLTVTVQSPSGRISETMKIMIKEAVGDKCGSGIKDMDILISRVEREYRGRRFFIDPEFSEDINAILELARRQKKSADPGLRRECSIALWSILKEIKSLDAGREADCAG